jgi:hypothetical protein
MRTFRVLALTSVVAVFAAAPGFAQVCHPKKPVTCSAASFTHVAVTSATAPAATKTTSVKPKAPAKVQHAMLCGPWVHWMCTGQPLV